MGDHAYTMFSIERHTPALTTQPVGWHQVLTDDAAVWQKHLRLVLTVARARRRRGSDLCLGRLLSGVKASRWDQGGPCFDSSLGDTFTLLLLFFHVFLKTALLRSNLHAI